MGMNALKNTNRRLTQTTRSPLRVLVAEDDDEMRTYLAKTLRHSGHKVVEIANGSELRAYFDRIAESVEADISSYIDIIVSDICMPGKTALDVLRDLKQVAKQVPIVLITAFGDKRTHREALAMGATAVFDKPFNIEEFKSFLTRTTTQQSSLRHGPNIA
jgi:two-component system response regulator (stage 0 sporulation protein F)